MEDFIFLLVYAGLPLLVLGVAFFAGNFIAARHEAAMARRLRTVDHVRTTDIRTLVDAVTDGPPPALVATEVTFGIDHFRGFLGRLKNIFGGEVKSYAATLDRARRETILRLREQAHAGGHNAVANIRIDFADISGNATVAKKASMVSILASGTAYLASTPAREPLAEPVDAPLSA